MLSLQLNETQVDGESTAGWISARCQKNASPISRTRRRIRGLTKHVSLSSRLEQFEKRQADLWRLIYLILVVVVAAFIWTSWPTRAVLSTG